MARIKLLNAITKQLFALLLLGFLAEACDDTKPNTTTLQRPSDFVQSGPGLPAGKPEYLFIADSALDFVTALDTARPYNDIEYVWSPVFYFPIMIPAGPAPVALATSSDGRLLLVASAELGSIQLLDTAELEMVPDSNNPEALMAFRIAAADSALFQLLPIDSCGLHCDTFMALTSKSLVYFNLHYALSADDKIEHPEITIENVYPAGLAPVHGHYVPAQRQLWVAQNSGTELLRLDLESGEINYFDVGESQQDIALSPDGNLLFVAHAARRRIAVYSDAATLNPIHVKNHDIYQAPDAGSDTVDLFMRDIPWRLTFVSEPTLQVNCLGETSNGVTVTKGYKN